jgi:hypothetical protein
LIGKQNDSFIFFFLLKISTGKKNSIKKKEKNFSSPSSFRLGGPATPPARPISFLGRPSRLPLPSPSLSHPLTGRARLSAPSSPNRRPAPSSRLETARAEPRAHDPPLSLFPRASEAFEEPRARALFFLPHSPSSPPFSSHPSAEKKLPEQQAPPRVVPPFGALLPRFVPWVSIASFLASSRCSFRSVSWSLGSVSANSIELHGRRPWSGSRLVSPAALSLESSSLRPPLSPGSFGSQNHAP